MLQFYYTTTEITANNFTNKGYLTGSHSYKWVAGSQSNINKNNLPKEFIEKANRDVVRNKHGKFTGWDEPEANIEWVKEAVSHYKSNKAYFKIAGNLTFNITNRLLNQEADILAGKNIIINAKELNNTREGKKADIVITFVRKYHYRYWKHGKNRTGHGYFRANEAYKQTLYSDKPTQIIAGGNLTINAEEVGNGEYQDHKSGYVNDVKKVEKDSNIKNASIDDTFKIINNSIVEKIKKDSAVSIEDYIEIPKNDNGMFIVNKKADNPKFSYLIETNPKMIDKGFYLSSDYFFSRIKFNPDRDIRLLGDSMYETKLINKAVLEGTGKRYLYSNNVNEERKKLFDNAVSAQKDLNLSLGVALSKEQINNLKSDILWYVEEVVNGEKVLVPKLYLSKNTLKSIVKEQGNIIKAGGNFVVNNVSIVDNSGKIIAKNNVLIKSKNIYQNSAYSDTGIYGNNIALIAKENIENIGGNILAENDINIFSENGDIKNSKKLSIHDNDYHDVFTDVRGSGDIVGNKISIVANNVENTGADVKAQDKIEIGARKNLVIGNLEAVDKKVRDDGKDYVLDEKRTNVGSNLKAKDISLTSLGDIGINGSNIVATNEASIQAKGDISIVAGKDSILHEERHSKSKGFSRSSSEESVAYTTHNVTSNIIGDKVNITSEKDVSLLGSNVQANTEGQIKADGNITQAGVKDINYHYEHTSKSRFGGLISKSTTSENYQENTIVSATVAGDKGLTYDSKNNLILSGVKVVSSGSIDLKGKNVEINPLEIKSYSKFEEKKKGFSAKVSLKGANYSYGKDKFSDNSSTIIENSNEIVAGKKLTIEADNKVKAKAVNIYSNDNISISGNNGVEISSGKNIQEREIKQSSTRINTGIGVKSSILNTVENVKNVDKLADFSGDSYDIVNKASNLVGAIKDGADAVNTILDPSYNGSQGAGTENLSITDPKKYISVHSGVTRSKSEIKTYDESTNKSSITGKNIEINSKDKSVQIIGTDIAAKNLEISAKENIDISGASEEHRSSNSSSSSGLSVSATLDKAPLTITANISGAQGRSNGTYNTNSNIVVDEKFKTESENLNISSSNIVADKVDIKAKNVVIESKQDKTESKNSSYGASVSVAVSPAGVELKNISVNGAKGKGKGSWTSAQTSVIAKNGGEITTDNFKDIGAIVGSENEREKLKISAKTIEVKDLEDSNKYENVGGGISLDFEENKPQVPNISVVHDKIDKEQITRATAINTEIKVNNEIVKAEDLGFNTDISNSQETTKDKEKHLNAELHTDLLGKGKQEELKKAAGIISDIGTALTSSKDTKGDFLERYKQASMMRAIGDQVEKNPEYLSILEKEAIKNGKIDDELQEKQVSVMNKLLNDALRAKGYAGPDIKMVLTDVTDPNGPYYTDTLTNVVVFDRAMLASANRDQILNALGCSGQVKL